jgi:hypothetical protein
MFKLEWNILPQLHVENIYASLSCTCFSRESVTTDEIEIGASTQVYRVHVSQELHQLYKETQRNIFSMSKI